MFFILNKMGFEYLDHTADIQLHCWGKDVKEAFEQAVLGLMGVMCDITKIEPVQERIIEVSAIDREVLLVDFLSEFLAIFDIDEMLFSKADVLFIGVADEAGPTPWKIKCMVYGEKYDSSKHVLDTEVKAITFSYLKIEEKDNRTDIYVVFDL